MSCSSDRTDINLDVGILSGITQAASPDGLTCNLAQDTSVYQDQRPGNDGAGSPGIAPAGQGRPGWRGCPAEPAARGTAGRPHARGSRRSLHAGTGAGSPGSSGEGRSKGAGSGREAGREGTADTPGCPGAAPGWRWKRRGPSLNCRRLRRCSAPGPPLPHLPPRLPLLLRRRPAPEGEFTTGFTICALPSSSWQGGLSTIRWGHGYILRAELISSYGINDLI